MGASYFSYHYNKMQAFIFGLYVDECSFDLNFLFWTVGINYMNIIRYIGRKFKND